MDNVEAHVNYFNNKVASEEAGQRNVVGPAKTRVVEGDITYTHDIRAGGLAKQTIDRGINYCTYVDERGNTVSQYDTSYYTHKEYDDGRLLIRQSIVGPFDKTINFGPISTKLSELFAMGFILEIDGWKYHLNQKLQLIRGREKYKLAKIPTRYLNRYHDMIAWVKDGSKPHFEPFHVGPKPKEAKTETDPFKELMLKYPIRKKTVKFIGNQTLEQYVKQQLHEQRKLENV